MIFTAATLSTCTLVVCERVEVCKHKNFVGGRLYHQHHNIRLFKSVCILLGTLLVANRTLRSPRRLPCREAPKQPGPTKQANDPPKL